MKPRTILYGRQILMIHRFKQCYLDLNLNNYTLIFDDGLYNHYLWFKIIREKFPKVIMIFAISTNIISEDDSEQVDMESPVAHELFFKTNCKQGFMNIGQIEEISNQDRCFIALHGHNHLYIKNIIEDYGLKYFHKVVKEEYDDMFGVLHKFIEDGIIYLEHIIFVTPYNVYDDLAIAILRQSFKKQDFCDKKLVITGPRRIDIETLI